jgi:phenylacetate-CoA ligase
VTRTNPEHEPLHWPADTARAQRLDRLRTSLAQAARSAFYGPRLAGARIESLDDLAALPLTTKDDVRAASPFGLLAVPREELYQYHESFGTTGSPTSSWLTQGDFASYAAQINQSAVEFRPGDLVLVRFPYAISVPAHIVTEAAHVRGACVVPAGSRTAISPYPRVIDLMRRLEATVLGAMPMEAIWVAEAARRRGGDPRRDFPTLRAIATAGELLTDARRRRIEAIWGVPVFNMYGCTEGGNIASDCSAGRLHLAWDHFVLEVLDERSWQPVTAGELGIGVLTTLTRQAMPLVRFVLGDYLRLIPDHGCPCGRTAPVVEHWGRDLNRFECGGRAWFVCDLEQRLLAAPVEAIGDLWLIEVEKEQVRFRAESVRPDATLYRRLEDQVRAELGLTLVIESAEPGTLLNRERLDRIEPVVKPRVVGTRPQGSQRPLTLDDLM